MVYCNELGAILKSLAVCVAIIVISIYAGAVYASEDEDTFEFLILVLADADGQGVLSETLQGMIAGIVIEYLIVPDSDETIEQVKSRLSIDGQTSFEYLIAVLRDARGRDVWTENLTGLLTEFFVDELIAPATGETSEQVRLRVSDPFARWNDLEPLDWWTDLEPYTCLTEKNQASPWAEAGMLDLGGSDPLSLIKYYGNGSYLLYGFMGFGGCTPIQKYAGRTHLDAPVDPTYYSLGNLNISVDIARVPKDAPGWVADDGKRETLTMTEAVELLNANIAPYFKKISEGKLEIRFVAGNDFQLEGNGSPDVIENQQLRLAGIMDCRGRAADEYPCNQGAPGGLNRIVLTDVTSDTGGDAYNGSSRFGLVSLRTANMELLVHEMGHAWMGWPHSFQEVPWDEEEGEIPNPYSNALDFMSGLSLHPTFGWDQDMPSTLAVNRYSAGWVKPEEVALHLKETGTYTLQPPRKRGYQFLVISSGREFAFTTIEVLDERDTVYRDSTPKVYDPAGRRPYRYDGVLVSRFDQSRGSGVSARFGPALYDKSNPDFSSDVNMGRDDFSVIQDGESREIGGGLSLAVSRNENGSYEVSVTGGRTAEFLPWCETIWFAFGEYDTGCALASPS